MHKISDNMEKSICRDYLTGMKSKDIVVKYGCNKSNVRNSLIRNNITYRQPKEENNKKYNIDSEYFQNIDSQNKAYILGFIYADGCVGDGFLQIKLHKKDIEILNFIKNELKYTGPILNIKTKYPTLRIYNSKMVKYLENHGVVKRKTYKISFPHFLKDDLKSHFVRGYFDGDGCISGGIFTLASNENMCNGIRDFINEKTKVNIFPPKERNNIYILKTNGRNKSLKILDLIYENSEFKMIRKFKRYKDLKNKGELRSPMINFY